MVVGLWAVVVKSHFQVKPNFGKVKLVSALEASFTTPILEKMAVIL